MRSSPSLLISPSHFEKVKFLGSGSVGKVYLTRNKKNGQLFAIKFVRHCDLPNEETKKSLERLASISHTCLSSIVGISLSDPEKKRPLSLVTRAADNGALDEFLSTKGTMCDDDKMKILFGVAEGMRHLEENGITHGNLSLKNVLLNAAFEPLVVDFGLDMFREKRVEIPQFQGDRDSTNSVDVFCYGLLAYTVLTGEFLEDGPLPGVGSLPECFATLLEKCWDVNPLQRLHFSDIVMMFLSGDLVLPRSHQSSIMISYESRVLSSSFATRTLIYTLDQMSSMAEEQRKMQIQIDHLREKIDLCTKAASVHRIEQPNEVTFDIDESDHDVKTAMNPLQAGQKRLMPVVYHGSNWSASFTARRHSTRHPFIPVDNMPKPSETDDSVLLLAPDKSKTKARRNSLQPPIPQNNFETLTANDESEHHSEAMSDPLERHSGERRRSFGAESLVTPGSVTLEARPTRLAPSETANIRARESYGRIPTKDFDASVQFPYAYSPFDGIFAHMAESVLFVTITGNSVDKAREADIRKVISFDWKKCWTSENVPNSYIQFDFAPQQVALTHYSIKTYQCGKGYSHLKSWVLEGCNPGGVWTELDRREDNQDLNGKSKIATFSVSNNNEYQVVRIRQIAQNHYGDNYLILTNVEFFGDVI